MSYFHVDSMSVCYLGKQVLGFLILSQRRSDAMKCSYWNATVNKIYSWVTDFQNPFLKLRYHLTSEESSAPLWLFTECFHYM